MICLRNLLFGRSFANRQTRSSLNIIDGDLLIGKSVDKIQKIATSLVRSESDIGCVYGSLSFDIASAIRYASNDLPLIEDPYYEHSKISDGIFMVDGVLCVYHCGDIIGSYTVSQLESQIVCKFGRVRFVVFFNSNDFIIDIENHGVSEYVNNVFKFTSIEDVNLDIMYESENIEISYGDKIANIKIGSKNCTTYLSNSSVMVI